MPVSQPASQSAADVAARVAADAAIAQAAAQAGAQAGAQSEEIANAIADAQKAMDAVLAQAVQTPGPGRGPASSPSMFYEAQVAARRELLNQLRAVEERREDIVRDITRANQNGTTASIPGLEARLKLMDARIAALDAQVAQANASVARAAAIPGSIVPKPEPPPREGPPEEVFILGGMFIVAVLFPLTIAYARRLWKRGATIIAPVPADVRDRLDGLTQAVEAIGIEVERIGEGQRFVTRVLGESRPVEHQLPINRHVGVE